MALEPDYIRIARIEEGLVRIHERIATNHREVMTALTPAVKESRKNSEDLIRLKRDRGWVYGLAIVVPSSVAAAIEWLMHFKKD